MGFCEEERIFCFFSFFLFVCCNFLKLVQCSHRYSVYSRLSLGRIKSCVFSPRCLNSSFLLFPPPTFAPLLATCHDTPTFRTLIILPFLLTRSSFLRIHSGYNLYIMYATPRPIKSTITSTNHYYHSIS